MTLVEKLEYLICFGYSVNFRREILNFAITLTRHIDGQDDIVRETWLPLGDHFYEKRIVEALDYMQTEIQKEF